MSANVFVLNRPPNCKIRVAGDLDAESAWKLDDALHNCFPDGTRVVVLDGSDLSSISPEGLEAIVRIQGRCWLEGVGFMMTLPPQIRNSFRSWLAVS